MTWNVRSLRDDARGVARVLRDHAPDVVLVQEAPRLWRWRSACARLAHEAGLVVVTGGRPAAGNLLLCSMRVRVVSSYDVLLPKRPGLHRRGAVVARLDVSGVSFTALGTHLDLDPQARLESARALRLHAADVVCADVNEEAGAPAWAALSSGLIDSGAQAGPTFPARAPRRRIDALLVSPRWVVASVQVPDCGPVTDHRPIVAELQIPLR